MFDSLIDIFEYGMDRKIPDFEPGVTGYRLNVGAGNKTFSGTTSLDLPLWDADMDKIPFADDSVGSIYAYHFLEHCANPVAVLAEFQRVLKVGGVVNIVVPYYTSQMQAQDLDHKKAFCEDTWKTLFNTRYYDKNEIEWRFRIGVNVIMGVVGRNLCLVTQLIKE